MNIISAFITDFQTAKAIKPSQCSFHDPTMSAKLLTFVNPATCNSRENVALAQGLAIFLTVITFISIQLFRALTWPSKFLADCRDSIYHRLKHRSLVDVGSRVPYRQRDALPFDHKMALRARFSAIRRVRAGRFAPPGAGTLPASREARDQSSWSALANRSSRTKCSLSQTPASCQSRNRRQQVMPLPQPISCGSISQGMPVLNTNNIPLSTARFGIGGRPPFGLSASAGSNGSTTCHSSSLTSCFAMPQSYQFLGFC